MNSAKLLKAQDLPGQGATIVLRRCADLLCPKGQRLLVNPLSAGTFLEVVVKNATTYCQSDLSSPRVGIVVFDRSQNIMGILPLDICEEVD